MKNLILSLMVILGASNANATSILPSILEYQEMAVENIPNQGLKRVTVFINGKVVAYKNKLLISTKTLSEAEVEQIQNLLQEAKQGELVKQSSDMLCYTMSPIEPDYNAGMFGFALSRGHECNGNVFRNETEAATELISLLDGLRDKMFARD